MPNLHLHIFDIIYSICLLIPITCTIRDIKSSASKSQLLMHSYYLVL